MGSTEQQYLRTSQAARYCNSTKSTLEKRRLGCDGPPFIKIGRTVIYDVRDLDAWLAGCRRASTSAPSAPIGNPPRQVKRVRP